MCESRIPLPSIHNDRQTCSFRVIILLFALSVVFCLLLMFLYVCGIVAPVSLIADKYSSEIGPGAHCLHFSPLDEFYSTLTPSGRCSGGVCVCILGPLTHAQHQTPVSTTNRPPLGPPPPPAPKKFFKVKSMCAPVSSLFQHPVVDRTTPPHFVSLSALSKFFLYIQILSLSIQTTTYFD